ncbi:MAG TPA: indole-3-glycerol phosphate synthase TrpC [Gemmatimonadaceae bacterium]|nr:indole-3-glycerol phosphate synthase TrpC [Gemmatimonadaceae bacterium]
MTEAQVFSRQWAPPAGVLARIMAEAADRVRALSAADRRAVEDAAARAPAAPSFAGALARDDVAIIAEVKRRSPSKGAIRESITAREQAAAFEVGGAAAISVLTEPVHFGGSLADLETARSQVRIPLLRKDFHLDAIQLYEARAVGASAALLIARALAPAKLQEMMSLADELGLEPLVEVRTEAELMLALELGARVIGINSRNLETLEVDASVPERLLRLIPNGVLTVAESGIESRSDVADRARWGADAVLVGSILSRADDPAASVRALTGVPRSPRAR